MLDTSKHSGITLLLNFLPLIVVRKLTILCACVLPMLDFQPVETRLIDTDLHPPPKRGPGRGRTRRLAAGLRNSLQEHLVFSALVSPAEKNRHYFPEGDEGRETKSAVRRLPCRSIGRNSILSTKVTSDTL